MNENRKAYCFTGTTERKYIECMAGFIFKEYPAGGVYLFVGKHGNENGQNWFRQGLRTSSMNPTSLELMRKYVEKLKVKSLGRMIQIISMENFFIKSFQEKPFTEENAHIILGYCFSDNDTLAKESLGSQFEC